MDAEGRLLGLNAVRQGEGLIIAWPTSVLRERARQLGEGQRTSPPRLGVALAPAHVARRLRASVGLAERDGLLVRGVEEGSPAAAAGIEGGDLLVTAAGRDLATADDLFEVLQAVEDGATLALGVVRGADERTVEVRFETA